MEDAKYQQHVQHLQGGVVGDGNNTTIHYYGTAGSPSVPHTPVPTSAWNVPFHRNPFFIGRDDLLKQLHDRLTAGTATALTQAHAINGLGGIGKTQMVVEYAYRYRETQLLGHSPLARWNKPAQLQQTCCVPVSS